MTPEELLRLSDEISTYGKYKWPKALLSADELKLLAFAEGYLALSAKLQETEKERLVLVGRIIGLGIQLRAVEKECGEWHMRSDTIEYVSRDLLTALHSLLQWVEIETDGRDWPHAHLIVARDAIKKATNTRELGTEPASRGEIQTLSAKLQEVQTERDKLKLERDEKAAIITAVGHELDELRARAESAKARQAAAEHRAQRVLLEIEVSRGEVVRPFVGSNGLVDEAALATTVSGILGTYARGEVVKANADIFANEPSEQLDTACHCGYTPERTPVYGTTCPIIAHRARSGKQWRDEYIEQFRARKSNPEPGEVVKACPICRYNLIDHNEDYERRWWCSRCEEHYDEPALWRRIEKGT